MLAPSFSYVWLFQPKNRIDHAGIFYAYHVVILPLIGDLFKNEEEANRGLVTIYENPELAQKMYGGLEKTIPLSEGERDIAQRKDIM
jgi:hypothetical protein